MKTLEQWQEEFERKGYAGLLQEGADVVYADAELCMSSPEALAQGPGWYWARGNSPWYHKADSGEDAYEKCLKANYEALSPARRQEWDEFDRVRKPSDVLPGME